MKLHYYKGTNFGDMLNPIVWEHFLPNFFDENSDTIFLGFGSILGFELPKESKKIVFSTGIAVDETFHYYGSIPTIDKQWDFKCVRGPLTAKTLNIPKELAVVDGAVLVKDIFPEKVQKRYDVSYMPHVGSLEFYDIEDLCNSMGIKFLDPRGNCVDVIREIKESKLVLAEAMHGAIVADALGTPWIPMKMYRHINTFKWSDWFASMNLDHVQFEFVKELYSIDYLKKIIQNKLPIKNAIVVTTIARMYFFYQKITVMARIKRSFRKIAKSHGFLSERSLLDEKIQILKEKIASLKSEYGR